MLIPSPSRTRRVIVGFLTPCGSKPNPGARHGRR